MSENNQVPFPQPIQSAVTPTPTPLQVVITMDMEKGAVNVSGSPTLAAPGMVYMLRCAEHILLHTAGMVPMPIVENRKER